MTRSGDRPKASSDQVRDFMSRQRVRDTRPEMELRRALHARGVRFRLHRQDLPGRPDLVVPRLRLAVFVDGCFWHACPEHSVRPQANREWWASKLAANVARDRRNDIRLREIGWEPLHVWEHQDANAVADVVAARWVAASRHSH
ncbi:MAG TPA: very short patch repair endonuclease [Thermoanaerobaculia bacterium]|nr:very short patch repair endonuclease [Thermoanaerobaculia bacterium]